MGRRLSEIKRLRGRLLKEDNVLLAYLFGSKVRGESVKESDVDVAVLLRDDSWDHLSRLIDVVAESLEIGAERIDIANLAKADMILKSTVVSEGIKLVDRGGYERALYEEVCGNLPDARRMLDSHFEESLNPVRREVVVGKLLSLDEELSVLKTLVLSKSVRQVKEDPVLKRVLRDSTRVAIECIMDVCKHIVASMRLGVAREYRDYPMKLEERGLMPKELAEELVEYVKLRNIIVHRYAEVDFALLYRKAGELVNSVAQRFRKHIAKLISSLGEKEASRSV